MTSKGVSYCGKIDGISGAIPKEPTSKGISPSSRYSCDKGYMVIEDTSSRTSYQRRSLIHSPARNKGFRGRKLKPKVVRWDNKASVIGSFCGPMIGKSSTFYSVGNNVTVTVVLPSLVSGQPSVPQLFLTYRFLQRDTSPPRLPPPETFLRTVPGTKCDVELTDCYYRPCVIRSPNFPGFYLRNLTCHYRVRQKVTPHGRIAQVEVSQNNEFKINVLSGHMSNDRYKPGTLTYDCVGDVIRVYDGRTTHSPLLAEFCGQGSLPRVLSSGPDMLIQLTSTPFQPLMTSRFELDVRVHFVPTPTLRMDSCSSTLDGSRNPYGVVRLPSSSVPANTTCSFRIVGRRPTDKVWLYFAAYHVPDLHLWTPEEHCDVAKLEIIYPKPKLRHQHHHSTAGVPIADFVVGTFCEKTSPLQCGHASDFADLVPSRPCWLNTESYISTGPELVLKFFTFRATSILGEAPHFVARYEIIDMDQPLSPDSCRVRIHSSEGATGRFESPRNLFLYGRGGTPSLTCHYEFRGTTKEKIRITVEKLNFPSDNCTTLYHPVTQTYNCSLGTTKLSLSRFAALNASERWRDLSFPLGCVCANLPADLPINRRSFVFESVSNQVDLDFSISHMSPRDDYRTYHFKISYEFLPNSGCNSDGNAVVSGVEGYLAYDTNHSTRCRWLLAALPYRSLYVTVQGRTLDEHCSNKFLLYNQNDRQPFAAFCASETDQSESVFSSSWKFGVGRPVQRAELTVLEVIAGQAGRFRVHWLEVTRPSVVGRNLVCELECPEMEACISAQLACDGTEHCPVSGLDESPDRCFQFPLLSVVVSSASAVLLIFVAVLVLVLRRKLRPAPKTALPLQHPHFRDPRNLKKTAQPNG